MNLSDYVASYRYYLSIAKYNAVAKCVVTLYINSLGMPFLYKNEGTMNLNVMYSWLMRIQYRKKFSLEETVRTV